MEYHGVPLPGSIDVSHVLVPATQSKSTTAFRGQYIAVLWNADDEESVEDFEARFQVGLVGGYRKEKFKYFGARVLVSVPSRKGTRKSSPRHWWAVVVRFEHRASPVAVGDGWSCQELATGYVLERRISFRRRMSHTGWKHQRPGWALIYYDRG
jgi:hypothetical protein